MHFDVHVAVDWSAASAPATGTNSVWTAIRRTASPERVELTNHATRQRAIDALCDLVDAHRGRRVLIGVDFSLGFPAGTARALAIDPPGRRAMWALLSELVRDDDRNRNNRFEVGAALNRRVGAALAPVDDSRPGVVRAVDGPFWGHPGSRTFDALRATRPVHCPLPVYRHAERVLLDLGLRPFSVWQLAYAGSVGGQTLVGIPRIASLAAAFPDRVRVWPFDTDLALDGVAAGDDAVVVAEVWPSAFAVDRSHHRVVDAAQVAHTTAETVAADRADALGRWFDVDLADRAVAERVVAEEGWILGVPASAGLGLPWRP